MASQSRGNILLLLSIALVASVSCRQEPQPFRKSCTKGGGCTKTFLDPPETSNVELGRLPETLWPIHHNIELQPYIYNGEPPFPFSGEVEMWLDCVEDTNVIYLNSRSLDIDGDSIEIEISEDSPIQPDPPGWTDFETDDDLQFFILNLDTMLVAGAQYRLKLAFTGFLLPPSSGLYWDSYQEDGETIYLVATQFQQYDTRTAFPCFDEPAFKATYDTTLVRQEEMLSLSNMEIVEQVDRGDGWVADRYDTTPYMSSYLLCFVVCDFVSAEIISGNGHVVRVWGRREYIHAADYPLQAAADVQDFFEDYTGVAYPLPKNDHIALPSKGGAMENWGLITYGEWALLYDPDWSTTADKRYTYGIIAHELAHMWFGNLVTCLWWNHTWLNEGFANFHQYRAMGDAGWSWDEIQTIDRIHVIMESDMSNTSTAVRVEVDSPWDSGPSFSSFVYSKGGTVVRMIRQILGETVYQRALERYLTRHAYGSVVTDDLWDALNEQAAEDGITDTDGSPLDFKEKLDSIVDQPGFPIVSLYRDGSQTNAYQRRFLNPPDQELNEPSPWNYLYNVPLTYATSDNPDMSTETKTWLNRENGTIDGISQDPDDWFVANIELSGFYMVDYDQANRDALVQQLISDSQVIPRETRAHLIHDAFVLARVNHHPEVQGFEMTRYMSNELDYAPWVTAERQLGYPSLVLARFPATFGYFGDYMRAQVNTVYEYLGWEAAGEEEEPNEVPSLRRHVLWLACIYGNGDCIQESQDQYAAWQEDVDTNPISTDHRLTVYCTTLTYGSQSDWDFAYAAYTQAAQSVHPYASSERNTLVDSMACSQDVDILQNYLQMILDETMDQRDRTRAMSAIAETNNVGRELVWQHLVDNWRDPDVTPPGVSKNTVFRVTTDGFATSSDIAELAAFFVMYPAEDEQEQRVYDAALSRVTANNNWAFDNQELSDWFQENTPAGLTPRTLPNVGRSAHGLLLRHEAEIARQYNPYQ